jgi:hypothetical protein
MAVAMFLEPAMHPRRKQEIGNMRSVVESESVRVFARIESDTAGLFETVDQDQASSAKRSPPSSTSG